MAIGKPPANRRSAGNKASAKQVRSLHNTLDRLFDSLAERDARVKQLNAEVADHQRHLQKLVKLVHAKNSEVDRLQHISAVFQSQVDSLQADRHLLLAGIQRIESRQLKWTKRSRKLLTTALAPYFIGRRLIHGIKSALHKPYQRRRVVIKTARRLESRGLHRAAELTKARAWQRGRLRDQILRAPWFDGTWYQEQNPDVVACGPDSLAHYMNRGAGEGRRPSSQFETSWYLSHYADVAESKVNPLWHFVLYGAIEGRKPNPLFDLETLIRQPAGSRDLGIHPLAWLVRPDGGSPRLPNAYLDANWYARAYEDISASGTDPLTHYLNHGWIEGRNPGPLFDNDWYLRQYPDVPGINPLSHYLSYGIAEGRAPCQVLHETFTGPAPSGPVAFPAHPRPLVSIVVPAHTSWLAALWCLHSIRANAGKVPYEVLLADDSVIHGPWGVRNFAEGARLLSKSAAKRPALLARGKYVLSLEANVLLKSGALDGLATHVSTAARPANARYYLRGEDGIIRQNATLACDRDSVTATMVCRSETSWADGGIRLDSQHRTPFEVGEDRSMFAHWMSRSNRS